MATPAYQNCTDLFFPETKGLALEDVDLLFAKSEEAHRQMSAVVHEPQKGDVEMIQHLPQEKQ